MSELERHADVGTVTTTSQAEALWDSLRDAFANTEKVIVTIIETRAWEPLGFDTFAQAWMARMSGIRLATEMMRAHVAYALFASGLSDAEAQKAVGFSIGTEAIRRLREQSEMGVPPSLATTRVRSHERSKPSAPETLHVRLTPDELSMFRELAEVRGLDVQAEAAKAVRAHFRSLDRSVS